MSSKMHFFYNPAYNNCYICSIESGTAMCSSNHPLVTNNRPTTEMSGIILKTDNPWPWIGNNFYSIYNTGSTKCAASVTCRVFYLIIVSGNFARKTGPFQDKSRICNTIIGCEQNLKWAILNIQVDRHTSAIPNLRWKLAPFWLLPKVSISDQKSKIIDFFVKF